MKTIEISGSSRQGIGKTAVKKIRRDGLIPANLYGLGEAETIAVDYLQVEKALASSDTYIVNLNVDGKTTQSIIRETQFHPVTDNIVHIDFMRISDEHEVELELPVKTVGTSKGVLAGGKLVPLMRRIKVRGIPSQLPDAIKVDVTNLELGKTIRVSEIDAGDLVITSPGAAGIAIIDIPRAVKTAAAEAAKGK